MEQVPPDKLLADLNKKSNAIIRLRRRRDNGKFNSVGAAIELQYQETERAKLQAQLPALSLVSE